MPKYNVFTHEYISYIIHFLTKQPILGQYAREGGGGIYQCACAQRRIRCCPIDLEAHFSVLHPLISPRKVNKYDCSCSSESFAWSCLMCPWPYRLRWVYSRINLNPLGMEVIWENEMFRTLQCRTWNMHARELWESRYSLVCSLNASSCMYQQGNSK